VAAKQHLDALENVYQDADENEKTRLLDLLLDAQRRLADAETTYYRGLLEYSLAIKNVHLQKGSLLDYNEIYLSEGPWPGKAHYDAARFDASRRQSPRLLNFILAGPRPISPGPVEQRIMPGVDSDADSPSFPQEDRPALPEPPSAAEGGGDSVIGAGVIRNAAFDPAGVNAASIQQ
jgi:hypothetical protein